MAMWRKSSVVVAVALAGGLVSPVLPAAHGQELTTQSTVVTHPCHLVKPVGLVSSLAADQGTVVSPETVVTRFPATVAPGEVFTAYIQPGAGTMRTTDGRQAGLLSYDVAFPSNSTNLNAYNNGGGSNISVPDGLSATVSRINANGQGHEFGPFARIWGGTSAYLGDNARNGDAVNRWQAGIQVSANTTFQFPEVALRMRAPVTSGGATISVGLKGAGASNGSSSNGSVNTIQGGEQGGSTVWPATGRERTNYFFCSSSANASSLSSTVVDSSLPRYIAQTSTALTSVGTHLPRSARTTTLSARVTTNEELIENVRGGGAMMRFDVRNKTTGSVVASPAATIGTDGVASASYEFPDLAGGNFRDEYEVTATYTGRADDIASSTSDPITYTVGYNEINTTVTLRSSNGTLTDGQMPVTLTADLAMPSGRSFPEGLQIQLYRNDQAHGSPIAISSGGSTKQITFPVDTLLQQNGTTTYRYRAEIAPLIIDDLDRYAGTSTVSVSAIVTGTNPGSPLPEGGQGSVSLEEFFRAPQLFWDWVSGSIGQAGTFSVGFLE